MAAVMDRLDLVATAKADRQQQKQQTMQPRWLVTAAPQPRAPDAGYVVNPSSRKHGSQNGNSKKRWTHCADLFCGEFLFNSCKLPRANHTMPRVTAPQAPSTGRIQRSNASTTESKAS